MSVIQPFKAVRPTTDTIEQIAALPYDVYSSLEAREVVKDKPLSFLNIDRPETYFPVGYDAHSPEVYDKASEVLYDMLEKGDFVQEEKPVYYLYQLTMGGRSQLGLVACASVDEYLNNQIKKHENTRADKELDRINHVDVCNANTGPIFLTYKGQAVINEIINQWIKGNKVLFDFTAEDGVRHQIWAVDHQATIDALTEAFGGVGALYIADGHHRAASAVKVAQKRRAAKPDYTGEEDFNSFLSVIFPDEQLAIMDYNRVVKDLNGLSETEFIEAVKADFDVSEAGCIVSPSAKATFGMYLSGKWYELKAKEGTYDANDPVDSLDVAILQDNLLTKILGIDDPKTDKRIDFVGGIRGLGELERRVSEDMTVAFSMYPTSIQELMDIADAGKLMPPKSTWFEPKLRSGIFIHLL